jgi:hypothetical protein
MALNVSFGSVSVTYNTRIDYSTAHTTEPSIVVSDLNSPWYILIVDADAPITDRIDGSFYLHLFRSSEKDYITYQPASPPKRSGVHHYYVILLTGPSMKGGYPLDDVLEDHRELSETCDPHLDYLTRIPSRAEFILIDCLKNLCLKVIDYKMYSVEN